MTHSETRQIASMAEATDPKASTQQYVEKHSIHELLENLLAELIYYKPAKPKQYLAMQLEKIKVAGTKPLLNKQDLTTMFGMFDVTAKGCVTEQQATNALRTVLGNRVPAASAASEASNLPLGQEAFVNHMASALCSATPLCKGNVEEVA